MIEEKDVDLIYKICDSRYRKVDDCNEIMEKSDDRQDKLEKVFIASNTKLNSLLGILSAIGIAVLGIAVKLMFP